MYVKYLTKSSISSKKARLIGTIMYVYFPPTPHPPPPPAYCCVFEGVDSLTRFVSESDGQGEMKENAILQVQGLSQ